MAKYPGGHFSGLIWLSYWRDHTPIPIWRNVSATFITLPELQSLAAQWNAYAPAWWGGRSSP